MKITTAIILLSTLLATGCAFKTSPYSVSVKNVESLKAANLTPLAVGDFTSTKPGLSSITCRAAGPVKVEPNFEKYIQNAFIDELKVSGLYDAASKIKITGSIQKIDFSSGITDGKWEFALIVSNQTGQNFTTTSTLPFSSSFVADRACQEVAQAFVPSVQKLIHDVITNPRFKEIAQ